MYKKTIHFVDKKHFGSQVLVYKSNTNYLIIIKNREEQSYFFLDNNLELLYPINSYMKKIGFNFNFEHINEELNYVFEINLSQYGCSVCPEWLLKLIRETSID